MATLGSLIVNVLANTSNFAKGMARARAELASFSGVSSRVKEATSGLNGVLAAVGVGFSMHQVISGLNQTAEGIDNLAKSADRIGITTEALGGLQYGAGLAGVSADQLTGALQTMTRQIGEAIHGGGKAKVIFEELGISVDSLANKSAEQQLAIFAEELNKMGSTAERTRAAIRLFGADGAGMINFLAEGEQGIRKYMKEAEQLGLTYSREEAAKVEEFNDAWTKLSETLRGMGTQIVIDISPDAKLLLEHLQESAKGAKIKPKTPNNADWWDVTKAIFSTQGRMDLDRKIGKGMWADAFTDRELGGTKKAERFRAFTNGRPGADMESKFANEKLAKILERAVLGRALYDPIRKGPAMMESGFKQLSQWADKAKEIGHAWSKDQFIKSLIPKPKSQFFIDQEKKLAERDKKRIAEWREKQYGDRFNQRGINSALQAGTAEAFRAIAESRIQQAMLDHAKRQLEEARKQTEEARKQTDEIKTLNANLTIETTGVG
jgi:hypothetical protein